MNEQQQNQMFPISPPARRADAFNETGPAGVFIESDL